MAESLAAASDPARPEASPNASAPGGPTRLDRLSSFRVTYAAILAYVVLLMASVWFAERALDLHFRRAVSRAISVNPANGPIIPQVENRVGRLIRSSFWTRFGDVRVDVFVLGADGRTPLYVVGRAVPPPPGTNPHQQFVDALRLLPATAAVVVSVPPDSRLNAAIAVIYGAVLITGLFFYNRRVARREQALLDSAMAARNASASRAEGIEAELTKVQQRLHETEPHERARADEMRSLEDERVGLQRKLTELAEREAELRGSAARATELDEERRALEDLLEEAMDDLGQKEDEIRSLQDRLKRADRSKPAARGRARGSEQAARRFRSLYKNLEIDERAIQDWLALRDETMKLRAEEGIKRLAEDPDTAAIRRKVGGLPPQLSIFELGFAGKGRIYYTRGETQRYRVLAIGAKNTQKTDLEYLSRLPG